MTDSFSRSSEPERRRKRREEFIVGTATLPPQRPGRQGGEWVTLTHLEFYGQRQGAWWQGRCRHANGEISKLAMWQRDIEKLSAAGWKNRYGAQDISIQLYADTQEQPSLPAIYQVEQIEEIS